MGFKLENFAFGTRGIVASAISRLVGYTMAANQQPELRALMRAAEQPQTNHKDLGDRDAGDFDPAEVAQPLGIQYHPSWGMAVLPEKAAPATIKGREYLRKLKEICAMQAGLVDYDAESVRASIWTCASAAVKHICVRMIGLDRSFAKMPLRKFDGMQRAAMGAEVDKMIRELQEVKRALGGGRIDGGTEVH